MGALCFIYNRHQAKYDRKKQDASPPCDDNNALATTNGVVKHFQNVAYMSDDEDVVLRGVYVRHQQVLELNGVHDTFSNGPATGSVARCAKMAAEDDLRNETSIRL